MPSKNASEITMTTPEAAEHCDADDLTIVQLAKLWIQLNKERQELDKAARKATSVAYDVEKKLIDRMEEEELQKITTDGQTLSPRKQFYARRKDGVSPGEAITALRRAKLADMFTVNSNKMRAFVAECAEDNRDIPKGVQRVMDVGFEPRLSMRKA